MSRLEVVLLAIFFLIITFFGITSPNNSFEWLMAAHDGMDTIRFILALALLSLGLLAPRYGGFTASAIRSLGLFMFGLLLGNVLLPDIFRRAEIHLFSLDIIGLIEGSIICTLYSFKEPELELFDNPASKPKSGLVKQA